MLLCRYLSSSVGTYVCSEEFLHTYYVIVFLLEKYKAGYFRCAHVALYVKYRSVV
jgi:hypothetical protein